MLVNRTKHVIRVCEEGLDQWTEARPGQVKNIPQTSYSWKKLKKKFIQTLNQWLEKLMIDFIVHIIFVFICKNMHINEYI